MIMNVSGHYIFLLKNDDWHSVNIYDVVTWDMKDKLPSNVDVLIDVVKSVKREENMDQEHKMTMLSR